MSGIVCIYKNQHLYVVDEFYGQRDTMTLIDAIKERYPSQQITIYPDSSGYNQNTTSNVTDIQLLKKSFKVSVKRNPSVKNRVNKLNKSLHDDKISVDINRCTNLVRCLESQCYTAKGEPDKTSGFDHMLDAFGYVTWQINFELKPYKRNVAQGF